MPSAGFERLRGSLFERGISERYSQRLLAELEDHFEDLETEFRRSGRPAAEAVQAARAGLGSDDAILACVLSRPELARVDGWLNAVVRSLLMTFAPPLQPAVGHADTGSAIARWSVSISLGTVLTVAMLLGLASTVASGA
jgi:hypothetical protein